MKQTMKEREKKKEERLIKSAERGEVVREIIKDSFLQLLPSRGGDYPFLNEFLKKLTIFVTSKAEYIYSIDGYNTSIIVIDSAITFDLAYKIWRALEKD